MRPPNLRSLIAQGYYRGGRSTVSRQFRNFSSSPISSNASNEAGGKFPSAAWVNNTSFFKWMAFGYIGYTGWDLVGLARLYLEAKTYREKLQLMNQRHDEMVSKAISEVHEICDRRR